MDIIQHLSQKYNVILEENAVDLLKLILHKRILQKDELLLEQGKISKYMYIVEEGIIRQFYYKDGRCITEHFSCQGDIATCIESLFLQEATNINIEAIEDAVVYLLDYEQLKQLTLQHPCINKLLQAILEYKLIVSQRKADSWRFETANERYQRFCEEYPTAAKRAPIAYIASYLLMAPETLSRVRAGVL